MATRTPPASARLRQKRTWKHTAIKFAVWGSLMVLLCLIYAKQEDTPMPDDSTAFSSRGILETPEAAPGDDEEGSGECELLHQQNSTTLCTYITTPGNCDEVLPFVEFYYCGSTAKLKPLSWILFIFLLLNLFFLLGTTADAFFTPTLEVIGKWLRMSPEVAGLTILALGNGAPDLATSISSLALAKPTDIVLGGIFGASMFVTTVVVAAVSFVGRHVKLDPPSVIRDISFFLVATFGVYFITWDGRIYLYEAICFLLFYFSYVAFALITHYCGCFKGSKKGEKSSLLSGDTVNHGYGALSDSETPVHAGSGLLTNSEHDNLVPLDPQSPSISSEDGSSLSEPVSGFGDVKDGMHHVESGELDESDPEAEEDDDVPFTFGRWRTWFMSLSKLKRAATVYVTIVMLPLYLSVPTIKWNRYAHAISIPGSVTFMYYALGYLQILTEKQSYWISYVVLMGVATIVGIVMFVTTSWDDPPVYKPVFLVFSFVLSIAWIATLADNLVAVLQSMGIILTVPIFVLGATVLAWGNSVGDLVANVVMAKKGFPGSALSASYGGPMMNMLIGMGVGLCIRTASIFPDVVKVTVSKSFLATGAFLFVSLYASLIVLWFRKFVLPWWWGAVLVVFYLLFNLITGLIEGHVIWKTPI